MKKTPDSKETKARPPRAKQSVRSTKGANGSDQAAGDLALAEAFGRAESDTTAPAHTEDRKFAYEPAQARNATALQGRIERISGTAITGWVWDPETPDRRVRLELLEGNTCLKTIVAAEDRPDLVQLGCGDGCHGFTIGLEPDLLPEGHHTLTLRCADTGEEVPGSPVAFGRVRAMSGTTWEQSSKFRYQIDDVSNSCISGWVMMPEAPSRRLAVALQENGRILTRAIASQFRIDLLSLGLGDGCYSFTLEPPLSLKDGEEHDLDIIIEDTGARLNKSPVRWQSKLEPDSSFFERLGIAFLREHWTRFARLRGYFFDLARYPAVSATLHRILASPDVVYLDPTKRDDVLISMALSLLCSGTAVDEVRFVLWTYEFWTARHDATLECLAALLSNRLDEYAKFSAGATEDLLSDWLDLCDLIYRLRKYHNAAALRLATGISPRLVSSEFNDRIRCLLLARTGDYTGLKLTYSRMDLLSPGLSAAELFALLSVHDLRSDSLYRMLLRQALTVGDDETVDRLSSTSMLAPNLIDKDELELELRAASEHWPAVAAIWARRRERDPGNVRLWVNEYKAYFKGGELRRAAAAALEAQLEPSLSSWRDEFRWYWRAATSAVNYRSGVSATSRVVWDLTPLLNVVRRAGTFGGIEKVTSNVIREVLSHGSSGTCEHVAVYWKDNSHRPVHVSYTDFHQAVFSGERDLLVLSDVCSPEDTYYVPQSTDMVIYLGAHWTHERYRYATSFYKSAGAQLCVMIHDLLPLQYPDLHPELGRQIFERWLRYTLPIANLILANSVFTREAIREFADTVGMAIVDPVAIKISSQISRDVSAPGLAKASPPSWVPTSDPGYALFVSSKSKRKNHLNLLNAWSLLSNKLQEDCPYLLLVGPDGDATEDVSQWLIANGAGRRIIELGYVSSQELSRLYRNCLFSIFPSFCEGWGMPVAEALNFGKMVITLRGTALEEVGGDLAIYSKSADPVHLAHLIETYIRDPEKRQHQEVRILNRFKPVTWEQTTNEVLKALAAARLAWEPQTSTGNTVPARAKSVPHVLFLCPSWGKRCGIAQYTQYAVQGIEARGSPASVAVSCQELIERCKAGTIDAFFVQHEYGLFDGENAALSGPDSTLDLSSALHELSQLSFPGGVIFHSVSLVAPVLASRFKAIAASAGTSYILSNVGAKQLGCCFLEHGVARVPILGGGSDNTGGGDLSIGTFGFLTEHKTPWKLIDACRRLNARLVACFSTDDEALQNRLHQSLCDLRIPADVRFGFFGEEYVLDLLSRCNFLYFPQQRVNYFATSGSARLAMNVDVPIAVSPALQFDDLGDAVIRVRHDQLGELWDKLRDPEQRQQAIAPIRQFREKNEIGGVYLEAVNRLANGYQQILRH